MKKLFFILLLMNVIFFALMQSGALERGGQVKQEQPPLHEEKIRLLDMTKIEPVKASPSQGSAQGPASPTPSSSSDLQLSMNISVPAVPVKDELTCLEWGDFSGQDLERAATALAALQLGEKLSQREIELDTNYWIYIPPLKNKGAINKKIGELRELGVTEYFVVTNAGHWYNAISLGVFKTRDAAQKFLNYLRTKGVRSAQIGERASKLKTTRFMLGGVNSETKARLIEMQKDFSGIEMANVPCGSTLTRPDEIGRMPRSSR
ncbi:MAG: SPOR domain-containing protein [Nitrosomonadales bacterium]|nr:SPOR domain-containing protein [Nitrosomonadales bacterium]